MLPGVSQIPSVHDAVALRLAEVDQRYTPTRRSVIGALAAAGRPVTISEIVAAVPRVPQSTAYRHLALFEDVGVVSRVPGAGKHGRFELAETLAGHHHHLVCTACGKIENMRPSPRLQRALAEAVDAAAEASGYVGTEHRFDLVGLCPDCG
jgi:Fe2+ or Zn2+ uptake regulation protein